MEYPPQFFLMPIPKRFRKKSPGLKDEAFKKSPAAINGPNNIKA